MSSASEAELAALYYGLFFDHVKNSLDNHSVWVFQQVNSVSTMAANDIMNDIFVQSNPHVMHGLQGILPCHLMNIETTLAAGERKVSMS
jgi:hypothetical protein